MGTTVGTQTNARGEFRLAGVPAGRAQVNALRIGYRTQSDTARVTAGSASSTRSICGRRITRASPSSG